MLLEIYCRNKTYPTIVQNPEKGLQKLLQQTRGVFEISMNRIKK